jgi:hypothetical protein
MTERAEDGETLTAAPAVQLTGADESFTHQLVAPHMETLHRDPAWGDRCYHQLFFDDITVSAGRQLYVNDGRRFAYIGVATPERQYVVRCAEPFTIGDDPNQARIGDVAIEIVRPLEEIRIVADGDDSPVRADLTFTGRFVPVQAARHLIKKGETVLTDYMNFFQSGTYSGTIEAGGRTYELRDHAGFRDRGWGLRKHEGSGQRGFMVAAFCELGDSSIYTILYETASGRRAFTNGWLIADGGVRAEATAIEHEMQLDGTLATGGSLDITWSDGNRQTLEFDVVGRNYLAAIGYTRDEDLKAPGAETFDLTDPAVVARLDGQNDQGCVFRYGGETGHGYVETGVGIHKRYRPEAGGG